MGAGAASDAGAAARHVDAVLATPYVDVDALRAQIEEAIAEHEDEQAQQDTAHGGGSYAAPPGYPAPPGPAAPPIEKQRAIVLGESLGDRTGWFGFGNWPSLDGVHANISGYPGDKPAGTQWYAARKIDSASMTRKIPSVVPSHGMVATKTTSCFGRCVAGVETSVS